MKTEINMLNDTKVLGLKALGLCFFLSLLASPCISLADSATFAPPQSIRTETGPIETWGVSSVDLNDDYCADLFFGNHRLQPTVYLGNCDGTFESRSDLVIGDDIHVDAHTTVFGDFQNIGCSDAHISVGGTNPNQSRHRNQLLLGSIGSNGECTGLLTREVGSDAEYPEQRARSSVPVDVDYDGDLDLVTTGYAFDSMSAGGSEAIFLNDGAGELTFGPNSLVGEFDGHLRTIFNVLADLNGDNELDLICGESTFPNAQCSKDVSASFAAGSLLSQDLSFDLVRSATGVGNVRTGVVDAFAEDIDGDGDNDLVALRRANNSGNAVRILGNTVVEGLNTTFSGTPMRCLGIPGEVDIESFEITGDYVNSRDIRFGQNANTQNIPNIAGSSVRRYAFENLTRANNRGLALPNIADGVDDNERGTYVGYIETERMWRICDVIGYEPSGVVVNPRPRRRFNKYGFRVEFSGAVGELVHQGYDPSREPIQPVVWVNKGTSGTRTTFENEVSNGGISRAITAFALGKGDFDNDGDMDFIATYENHGQRNSNYLYSNDGAGNFERSRFTGCLTGIAESVAIADLNDDGRLDPVISCAWFGIAHRTNHAHSVWLNNTDNDNKAIMFSLSGAVNGVNSEGIGAKIRVTDANDRSNTFGRGSQDSEFVHCGVALRTAVDVIVDWPGGVVQNVYDDVSTAAFYKLQEGSNTAELVKTLGSPSATLPTVEVNFNGVNETAGITRVLVRLADFQTNTSNTNIEVDYSTVDLSATAGEDYTSISGTAVIEPGRRFV